MFWIFVLLGFFLACAEVSQICQNIRTQRMLEDILCIVRLQLTPEQRGQLREATAKLKSSADRLNQAVKDNDPGQQ